MHSQADPASPVMKKHSRPVWQTGLLRKGCKKWDSMGNLSGSFLSPISYWARARWTPRYFQVAFFFFPALPWPLMKPDASVWLSIPDWEQRGSSAWVGHWPRKRKMEVVEESWKAPRVLFDRVPVYLVPTCKRWAHRATKSHTGLEKEKINNQHGLQKKLMPP